MLFQRIFSGVANQAARLPNLVHNRVASIDTGTTTNAFVLLALANIDTRRTNDNAQATIDAIPQGGRITSFFAGTTRLATFGIVGNDQRIRVEHHALETSIRAHVLANLLAQEPSLHVEKAGVEKYPEQLPAGES
jgi:hypothetical protein